MGGGEDDGTPAPAGQTLRDYGLARMAVVMLNAAGQLSVTVRTVTAEDARRIMAGLDDASVG